LRDKTISACKAHKPKERTTMTMGMAKAKAAEGATALRVAASYSRYSSDAQKDRSIEDQQLLNREFAARNNLRLPSHLEFSDRALTGATLAQRSGAAALMQAMKDKRFDALVVENLDRLARDWRDLADIYGLAEFHEIEILTLDSAGRPTDDITVFVNGLQSRLWLKGHKRRVRDRLGVLAKEGKLPGAVPYGYRAVPGQPGVRVIYEPEAGVLRFIYAECVRGQSPRQIAAELERRGIPAPDGGSHWSHQTFTCGRTGLIGREIHRGEIVWNTQRSVLNRDTGKTTKRPTPPSEWIRTPAPHLRIIPEALWDAAMKVRKARAAQHAPSGKKERAVVPRNRSILSGILRCGVCGGNMRLAGANQSGPRMVCATAFNRDECRHRRTYDLRAIQECVGDWVQAHVDNPQAVMEAVRNYQVERAKAAKHEAAEADRLDERIAKLSRQIERLTAAILDTEDDEVPELTGRLKPLQAERGELRRQRERLAEQSNVITIHPKMGEAVAQRLRSLVEALKSASPSEAGKADVQAFFASIEVHETAKRQPYEITPACHESALGGLELPEAPQSTRKVPKIQSAANASQSHQLYPRSASISAQVGQARLARIGHMVRDAPSALLTMRV
jgi:DNA invertase Pin-like site-specific DNA recombinase